MNQRIKELAQKASMQTDWWDVSDAYNKKFTKLIVKEMCDMMRQCQYDCDTGDASETNWGYISQLQGWIDRFERHFGVLE